LNPVLFDKHLKIDLNLKASQQKYRFANQGAIGAAINFDPTKPVYSDSKRYGGYWEWLDPNPELLMVSHGTELEEIRLRC
jgi:iron complex outermembrane receptor protein